MEENSRWKSMCEQANVNSFTFFEAFFTINPGFQPTKHEPLCVPQSKHNSFDFFCDLKKALVAQSSQNHCAPNQQ